MERPPEEACAWAAAALGSSRIDRITSLAQGAGGGPWQLDVTVDGAPTSAVLGAGDPADAAVRARFATEAAALTLAGDHQVPAPRVLAVDLDGSATGHLALLTTKLAGSSRIPEALIPERLRILGGVAARLHAIAVTPSDALPLRTRSLAGADLGPLAGASASLLRDAAGALAAREAPDEPHGLVHGDLWPGNTLWDGDTCSGAIDWDFAGVGPAGVDLGSLRCDAAVLYGADGPVEVLDGWQAEHGAPARNLAWWDVVAGVATPADLREWLPNFHAQGRRDLDLATVTRRRDAFLRAALDRLS